MQRTPRSPRSIASVRPVGPAPIMRTCVSMLPCMLQITLLPRRGQRYLPLSGEGTRGRRTLHHRIIAFIGGRLEIGELGAFLHEVADRAFERLRWPSAGARKVCSIFMASSTRSGAPRCRSVPGLGEDARHRARHRRDDAARGGGLGQSATNGSIQCSRDGRAAWSDRDRGRTTSPMRAPARRRGRGRTAPPSRATNCKRALPPSEFHASARRGRTRARVVAARAPWRKLSGGCGGRRCVQPSVRSQGERCSDAGCSRCSCRRTAAQAAARSSGAIAAWAGQRGRARAR